MISADNGMQRISRQLELVRPPQLARCAFGIFNRVQYKDGEVVVFSNNPDYEVIIDGNEDESPSFATGFSPQSGARLAILKSMAGDVYGIGRGVLAAFHRETGEQTIQTFGGEKFQAAVGQPCEIPELGISNPLQTIQFRLEHSQKGSGGSFGNQAIQFPLQSPFFALDHLLKYFAEYEFGLSTNPDATSEIIV